MPSDDTTGSTGRQAFDRDGVVPLLGHLAPETTAAIAAALARCDEAGQRSAKSTTGFWSHSHQYWRDDGLFELMPQMHRLLEAIAGTLGCEALWLLEETFLVKEPGSRQLTPWHQDLVYYPLRGEQVATAWIALDTVGFENGAVQYVAGSHRWGRRFQPVEFSSGRRHNGPGVEPLLEEAEREVWVPVWFSAAPGDCILHHGLTLHGSGPNTSGRRRRAWALTVFGESTRVGPTVFPWHHPWAEAVLRGEVPLTEAYDRVLPRPVGDGRGHLYQSMRAYWGHPNRNTS